MCILPELKIIKIPSIEMENKTGICLSYMRNPKYKERAK